MSLRARLLGALVAWGCALAPASARTEVDLSGEYRLDILDPLYLLDFCTWSVTQTGTDLSILQICPGVSIPYAGTISPATGSFSVSGDCSGGGDFGTISGTGAPDALSISALTDGCPIVVTLFATRCGNGIADPGEDCEDGNRSDDDCCSASCEAEPAGGLCDAPSPPCSVATCDGAGACVPGTATAAGAPCDLDADQCSVDECDGAGSCLATGETLECGACGSCEAALGCVGNVLHLTALNPPPPGECLAPHGGRDSLTATNRAPDSRDRVQWTWGRGHAVDPASFGDPTATTDYLFCAFWRDSANSVWRPLAQAGIPAGTGWTPRSGGFSFQSHALDGPQSVLLKGAPEDNGSRARVRARGASLRLSDGAFSPAAASRVAVQLQSSDGGCWGSALHNIQVRGGGRQLRATD